jgi:hypothetical protein
VPENVFNDTKVALQPLQSQLTFCRDLIRIFKIKSCRVTSLEAAFLQIDLLVNDVKKCCKTRGCKAGTSFRAFAVEGA